jgi:long-chain-fatty-acid---luciferin-component ligase
VIATVNRFPLLQEETLHGSSQLDQCIFGLDESERESTCYDLPLSEQQYLRRKFLHESVEHHLAACFQYRSFASRVSAQANDELALDSVPLLPTTAFKREAPLSIDKAEIAKWCTSSGTRGKPSLVGRDRLTLERLLGSVRAGLRLIEHWYEHELCIINLGPDSVEAGNIWFAYVMSLVELSYPTIHTVVNGKFDLTHCIRLVRQALEKSHQVGIVGPPFRVLELVHFMDAQNQQLRAGKQLTVVTAGGWKRASGKPVPRAEFENHIGETLGLDSRSQYRDAFNQAELNTVLFECAAHRKHVPPWVHARARDPRTLNAIPHGETGLLSFLDASANSFPSFIVGDDVGVVEEGKCPCGREGLFIRIQRRIEGRHARGCALVMDA